MAEHAGWTLKEAIRRTVDPDLLTRCVLQRRQSPQADATWFNPVTEALRRSLLSGQLVARGRRGSPEADLRPIPDSAWEALNFDALTHFRVSDPAPSNIRIYDLRIVPALHADDFLERLDGQPLVHAFKKFVFDDPQVASLRRRALAHGGRPRNVGHPRFLYQAYWYVDHGSAPEDDAIGFLLEKREGSYAQAANDVLRERFGRLIKPLQDGRLVADGAQRGNGAVTEISRAMWLRPGVVLDLMKGDLFDRYPDPGDDPADWVSPLYLGLMLRRPGLAETAKLHVKPTEHHAVRPPTALSLKPAGKGSIGAADRTRDMQSCREWLGDLMGASPDRRTHTNEDLLAMARTKWPGISERSFAAARKLAIADTGAHVWGAAGATPKSPQR